MMVELADLNWIYLQIVIFIHIKIIDRKFQVMNVLFIKGVVEPRNHLKKFDLKRKPHFPRIDCIETIRIIISKFWHVKFDKNFRDFSPFEP